MEHRQLGTTGIRASVLGFGMWPIGGTQHAGDYGTVSNDDAIAAIRRALDLGVTLFDAAPAYGNGHAEVVLGEALGSRRDEAATEFIGRACQKFLQPTHANPEGLALIEVVDRAHRARWRQRRRRQLWRRSEARGCQAFEGAQYAGKTHQFLTQFIP